MLAPMSTKCGKCQSTRVAPAALESANLVPTGGGMLAATIKIPLRANACLDCGHIDFSADPEHLKGLGVLG